MNQQALSSTEQVLDVLALRQRELVQQVADLLVDMLPPAGVPASASSPQLWHQQQVSSTVQRIHDVVQHGARLSWSMVSHEYAWAAGVLPRLGITWEHHALVIATYFATARQLTEWTPDALQTLAALEHQILVLGKAAYCTDP